MPRDKEGVWQEGIECGLKILVMMKLFCVLTTSTLISCLSCCTTVLQDNTFGVNWIKSTTDLTVIFHIPSCLSTVISELKVVSKDTMGKSKWNFKNVCITHRKAEKVK